VKEVREDLLAPPGLSVWSRAQRTLQIHEAWLTFREWLDRDNPRLQYSVARGLALASTIPETERHWAALMRAEARARLAWLLPPGTVLCMPTTPFPAPPRGLSLTALDPLRARIGCLTAHGGLTGVPQVSLPGATAGGLPVGLSILGARGSDAALVAVARAMEAR
jgi:amidase